MRSQCFWPEVKLCFKKVNFKVFVFLKYAHGVLGVILGYLRKSGEFKKIIDFYCGFLMSLLSKLIRKP